jgi:hypothetical protein
LNASSEFEIWLRSLRPTDPIGGARPQTSVPAPQDLVADARREMNSDSLTQNVRANVTPSSDFRHHAEFRKLAAAAKKRPPARGSRPRCEDRRPS